MKAEELNKARNPLLPAAWVAIRRAALQAREQARRTRTAIVVMRRGKLVRIEPYGAGKEEDQDTSDRLQDRP